MKRIIEIVLLIIVCIAWFLSGMWYNQKTIEERALTINKTCYDSYDLEFIFRDEKDGLPIKH